MSVPGRKKELLAVPNEDGRITSRTVSRRRAHREGLLHGASHVYLYSVETGKLRILLQRRSPHKDSYPNCLDISAAGHMEAGMDFPGTARKELEEELGLRIPDNDLHEAFLITLCDERVFHGMPFRNREICRVYFSNISETTPLRLQEEEVAGVVWMDADEILRRIDGQDPEICLNPEAFRLVLKHIRQFEEKQQRNCL